MANNSINLTSLDFDEIRTSLKSYLKGQNLFSDYDFEGSNISVLIDLLAYNTYHNSFYLNQVASESFLDSAQMRESVTSHCKDLNYVPKSFSSAFADISIKIKSDDVNKTSITIPKGTKFSGRVDNNSFIFSTNENYVTPIIAGEAFIDSIRVYEGIYLQESFASDSRLVLNNSNIDTDSLVVTILEDNGSTILEYKLATNLFGLDEKSKAYFLQGASNGGYEITFGDGIVGRKPKENSLAIIEYRLSNGELPNGCQTFKAISTIDDEANITVYTNSPAIGGSVAESIESIKFNAPKYFTTQERAVNAEDYENLLKKNFSIVNAATAFGGEDLDPPVYGKVFVSVDLKDLDFLPATYETEMYRFLKDRSSVSIDPVFVSPSYIYLKIDTNVRYNISKTSLNENDIKTLVTSRVIEHAQNNLNDFAKPMRYSRLTQEIDSTDISIISNETDVSAYRIISGEQLLSTFSLNYDFAINDVYSSEFMYRGKLSKIIERDNVIYISNGGELTIAIGNVDKLKGKIDFFGVEIDSIFESIKVIVKPSAKDIVVAKNSILNILGNDININIERIKE